MSADFAFCNYGSVCLLTPLSPAARAWIDEHLPDDVLVWGRGVALEPHYADNILEAIGNDGLTISGGGH